MKSFFAILLLFILSGCANFSATVFSYSGEFKLSLPGGFLDGASVFSVDELSVKTRNGVLFSGLAISNSIESLPDNFNIRKYPEYLLRLRSISDLSIDLAKKFKNSSGEIDYTYGLDSVQISEVKGLKIYSLCKAHRCLAYVLKRGVDDQVLAMHSVGLDRKEFVSLIQGGLLGADP